EFDVEEAAARQGREPRVEFVGARGGDVDRVFEPFAGVGKADEVAAAGVGGGLEVDGGGAIGRAAFVGGSRVVKGDAFAAVVEIFGLNRVADVEGRALEGARCGIGYMGGELDRVEIGDVAGRAVRVHRQAQDVLT